MNTSIKKGNMLLYTGIGDSYGLAFEFSSKEFTDKNNDVLNYKRREKISKGWEKHQSGQYSDDTDCSLAVVTTLLSLDGLFDSKYFLTSWKSYLQENPDRGYSKKTKDQLLNQSEQEILTGDRNSTTNGCLMGAHFLGLLQSPEKFAKASVAKCLPMHANPQCVKATTFIAYLAHNLYYKTADVEEALSMIKMEHNFKAEFKKVECDAIATINGVLYALQGKTKIEVLKRSIELLGDVDSVASIALGLHALNADVSDVLPSIFYENLERPNYYRETENLFQMYWRRLENKFPIVF